GDDIRHVQETFRSRLEEDFEASRTYKPNKADWLEGAWKGFEVASGEERRGDTAVPMDALKRVADGLVKVPAGFNMHPRLVRIMKAKEKSLTAGKDIDWATAEALAFGTLLLEGTPVRLSGQDSGRGTFSQRHSVLVDQQTEDRYVPLQNLDPSQAM